MEENIKIYNLLFETFETEIERLAIKAWRENIKIYNLLLQDLEISLYSTEGQKVNVRVKLFSANSGFIAEVMNYPYILTGSNKNGSFQCIWTEHKHF